jgi:hypothetical protein
MRRINYPYELISYSLMVHQNKILTGEEELELAGRYLMGDVEAGQAIISSNLREVLRISRAYFHHDRNPLEIINAGNIGLAWSLETFDPGKGMRFSHHAEWWVHKAIWIFIHNQVTFGRGDKALPQTVFPWINVRQSPRVGKDSDTPPRNRVIYSLSSPPAKRGLALVKNPVWKNLSPKM